MQSNVCVKKIWDYGGNVTPPPRTKVHFLKHSPIPRGEYKLSLHIKRKTYILQKNTISVKKKDGFWKHLLGEVDLPIFERQ